MANCEGSQILILEDEPLIAAALEEFLVERGCRLHWARRVPEALVLLGAHRFDAAFLDMNLDGELSIPVAKALSDSDTPFVFMSGYKSSEVENLFGSAPILRKPFSDGEVLQALQSLVRRRSP